MEQPHLIRTFIAVELPAEVRELLERLQGRLRGGGDRAVKWVEPIGIHLTLRFLGDVDEARVPDLEGALRNAARGFSPFTLETGGPGAFPSLHRPRVVWLGVQGDLAPLLALKEAIDDALRPLGFAPEERGFSPHLTLGRVRPTTTPAEVRGVGDAVRSLSWQEWAVVPIGALSLMRSSLTPSGAIYRALAVVPLEG